MKSGKKPFKNNTTSLNKLKGNTGTINNNPIIIRMKPIIKFNIEALLINFLLYKKNHRKY